MKVTINISGADVRTFDVNHGKDVDTLQTFRLKSDSVDEAKLAFAAITEQVFGALNEITDELYPPVVDPLAEGLAQARADSEAHLAALAEIEGTVVADA